MSDVHQCPEESSCQRGLKLEFKEDKAQELIHYSDSSRRMLSKASPFCVMAATSDLPFMADPSPPASYSLPPCHSSSQQKTKVFKSKSPSCTRSTAKRWLLLFTLLFVVWFQRSYSHLREIPLPLNWWILKDFYWPFIFYCVHSM